MTAPKGRGAARARALQPISVGSAPRPPRRAALRLAGAGGRGRGRAPAMLITLCYLYLWARWGPRSAALVRSTVRRLHRSRCSFTFCARQPQPEERVCLRIGGKVFCTGEAQVEPHGCAGDGRGMRGDADNCHGNGDAHPDPAEQPGWGCGSILVLVFGLVLTWMILGIGGWQEFGIGEDNARRGFPHAVTAGGKEDGTPRWSRFGRKCSFRCGSISSLLVYEMG